jgi:predicted dehydrogenase
MGRIHARILSDMGVLAGIADTDIETATGVARTYDVPAFESYEALIENTEPIALIISTPTSTHASIANQIASKYDRVRGLLIEKPLASTLEDGKKVAEVLTLRDLQSHSDQGFIPHRNRCYWYPTYCDTRPPWFR